MEGKPEKKKNFLVYLQCAAHRGECVYKTSEFVYIAFSIIINRYATQLFCSHAGRPLVQQNKTQASSIEGGGWQNCIKMEGRI